MMHISGALPSRFILSKGKGSGIAKMGESSMK